MRGIIPTWIVIAIVIAVIAVVITIVVIPIIIPPYVGGFTHLQRYSRKVV